MKTFVLTDHFIEGEVFLYEDHSGTVRCDFSKSDARASQIEFLLRSAEGGMDMIKRNLSEYSVLTEITITFDMFWQKLDAEFNMIKRRLEKKYYRMSENERKQAYNTISKQIANVPYKTRKKCATTYLEFERQVIKQLNKKSKSGKKQQQTSSF